MDRLLSKRLNARKIGSIKVSESVGKFLNHKAELNFGRYKFAEKLCELLDISLVYQVDEKNSVEAVDFEAKLYRPRTIYGFDRNSESTPNLNFKFIRSY